MTFAAGSRGIYGWGRSGGSGCRRGGTLALIFAYDFAFVFAFAVSLPSVVTLSGKIYDPMAMWQHFGMLATSPWFDWFGQQGWCPGEFSLGDKLFHEF